jgi:hypothetical protein
MERITMHEVVVNNEVEEIQETITLLWFPVQPLKSLLNNNFIDQMNKYVSISVPLYKYFVFLLFLLCLLYVKFHHYSLQIFHPLVHARNKFWASIVHSNDAFSVQIISIFYIHRLIFYRLFLRERHNKLPRVSGLM